MEISLHPKDIVQHLGEVASDKYSDPHFNTFRELKTKILVFDEMNGPYHRIYLCIKTLDREYFSIALHWRQQLFYFKGRHGGDGTDPMERDGEVSLPLYKISEPDA